MRRSMGFLMLTCCLAFCQTAEKKLAFEAASVKPSAPSAVGPNGMVFARTMGGPGTKDPGRIRYSSMSLKLILLTAYDAKDFQIAGPAWLETERFDIDATMPPATTHEQLRVMLQNLLSERFKLTFHRESKEVLTYALVLARNGPKMAEPAPVRAAQNTAGQAPPAGPVSPSEVKRDREGFPIPPPGYTGMLQFVVGNRAPCGPAANHA